MSAAEPEVQPIRKERTVQATTMAVPVSMLNSPEASGRYGLLTLSISTSHSWLVLSMVEGLVRLGFRV